MAVGDLAVKLRADTAEFESDMGRAVHVANREMESMVAKATAAGVLIGNALTQMASNFARQTAETLKMGDELSKLSQRTGQTVQRLSELQMAAELSNVGVGSLTTGLSTFNKALVDAQDGNSKAGQTFKALGVDITAGPEQAMRQFIKAVNELPNPETKLAAMRVGFGRAGDALIPMIGSLDETTQRLRNLGVVMSEDLAKKSERFNDAMGLLTISGRALYQQALMPIIEPLTTIAESMLKSKERGTSLKDTFIELGKAIISTHGTILSYVPFWGKTIEDQAQRAFNALDRLKQSGIRPIGPAPNEPQGPPSSLANPEAVACAVSGGKWVNGACQREKPRVARGRTARDPAMSAEQIAREEARAAEEEAKTVSEAFGFLPKMQEALRERERFENMFGEDRLMGMSLEDVRAFHKAYLEAIDAGIDAEERAMRAAAGFTEDGKAVAENTKEATTLARDLGLTFSSAFENALRPGAKLRDLIKGLGTDLSRLGVRKFFTEPMIEAFETFIKTNLGGGGKGGSSLLSMFSSASGLGGFLSNLIGGGGPSAIGYGAAGVEAGSAFVSTGSGFVPALDEGTPYVTRTGLALIHQGERVVPAAENRRGDGGLNFTQINHVETNVDAQRVQHAMAVSERRAVASIEDLRRRRVR